MKTTKKAIHRAAKLRAKAESAKIRRAARKEGGDNSGNAKMAGEKNVGLCRFCLEEKPLRQSHIIPKFHMRKLVSAEKRHAYHITIPLSEEQKMRWEKKQDFHRRLFCEACEQKFSKVESTYSAWWQRLSLDEKTLQTGKDYTVDKMGNWSEEQISDIRMSPSITLTGVDMDSLKRMLLINIFRLHCHFKEECGIVDYPAVEKYRKIVSRFLAPEGKTDPGITYLANFSVEASYVFVLSGEQCMRAAHTDPFDVLPANMLPLGVEIMMHGDFCCFMNPVLWRVKAKQDEIGKTSLTMRSTIFHYAFPCIADYMVRYEP